MLGHLMTWYLKISNVKIWLWKELLKWNKKHFSFLRGPIPPSTPYPLIHKRGRGKWNFPKMAVMRDGKFFLKMERTRNGWLYNGKDGKFLISVYIVGRGPYIAYPPTLPLSHPIPIPRVLSVVLFLWLDGWSRHIWYAFLLNNNMDLNMFSLGTSAPGGPWCVFYSKRCQVYWGLTYNVVFYWYSDLISDTNTCSTLRDQ